MEQGWCVLGWSKPLDMFRMGWRMGREGLGHVLTFRLWSSWLFPTQMFVWFYARRGRWLSFSSIVLLRCHWRANNPIPDTQISSPWCSLEGSVCTSTWQDGSGLRSLSLIAECHSQGCVDVFAEGLFTLCCSNPVAKPQSKPCSEEIIFTLSTEPQRALMSSLSPVSDGAAGVSINYLIVVFEKCP